MRLLNLSLMIGGAPANKSVLLNPFQIMGVEAHKGGTGSNVVMSDGLTRFHVQEDPLEVFAQFSKAMGGGL